LSRSSGLDTYKYKYMSVDVVNEQIAIMSNSVLRAIIKDIKDARWFAVMADETRDVSGAEQFTVCVRRVSDRFTVSEDLLGLVDVPTTDSDTLYSVLEDVLIRRNLLIDNCRGQAYDGASNMSGHSSGVAARMLAKQPAALAVHCLAHCINLCLQEVSSSCRAVRDALNTVHDVTTLIKRHHQRECIFLRTSNAMQSSVRVEMRRPSSRYAQRNALCERAPLTHY